MFDIFSSLLPAKQNGTVSLDKAAELLKTSPAAIEAFEKAYFAAALNEQDDNFFHMNSRQAAEQNHERNMEIPAESDMERADALCRRIVDELLAQTTVYQFDGDLSTPNSIQHFPALPAGQPMVSNSDINAVPAAIRPQLSGELMAKSFDEPSYPHLLYFLDQMRRSKNEKYKQTCYNMFRQGMEILDLDAITYKIIQTNRNSMGHWLPALVEACRGQDFFKIPATRIASVPLPLLQLTRCEYTELTPATLSIVDRWAYEAFHLNEEKSYFIKTGVYSSKYDFRNAKVTGAKEIRELGEYLLFIHYQACQMASPLTTPTIYGAGTTTEWVVRDFIEDKENNPCIYKGMPLHTEYRVFLDADTKEVIGISPYWEPETMKKHFKNGAGTSIHDAHDYAVYKAHESVLMSRYEANKDAVVEHIRSILPRLNLTGQWSLDVMQNGDDFYLIDMAIAENSAFYNCVPPQLRKPSTENWIPQLSDHT